MSLPMTLSVAENGAVTTGPVNETVPRLLTVAFRVACPLAFAALLRFSPLRETRLSAMCAGGATVSSLNVAEKSSSVILCASTCQVSPLVVGVAPLSGVRISRSKLIPPFASRRIVATAPWLSTDSKLIACFGTSTEPPCTANTGTRHSGSFASGRRIFTLLAVASRLVSLSVPAAPPSK